MQTKIYTPANLYADFQPTLHLRDSVVSDERIGGVVYREVYFSGRETDDGRVLIYGVYAYHDDGKKHNAILIIPDYHSEIELNIINFYVRLGYNVLMFDYKGENNYSENYTNYPTDVKFANIKYAERHLDFADIDAKKTCWYEWCCVASYAVSFLKTRIETGRIGVLGIKNGAEILWHLLSRESRVSCGVALFGAGWRSYKHYRKYSSDDGFDIDDERIRYMAGVDSHAFAPYCKCPVALFAPTNCAEFDADRSHDTIRRVNSRVETLFCLSPRLKDCVDLNCLRNTELFFGIHLNGQKHQRIPEPKIFLAVDGETVIVNVESSDVAKPKNVEIFVCENQIVPARRNWVSLDNITRNSDTNFQAEYSLVNGGGILFAFAVIEYRNGFTLSTPIASQKCPKTAVIKTNLIYSNIQSFGDFTYGFSKQDIIADSIFYKKSPLLIAKGPMGICGIYGKSGLITYKLNDNCVDIKQDSIFKFDVYCKTPVKFKLSINTCVGGPNEQIYSYELEIPRGEVWQNFNIPLQDFKTNDGMIVSDASTIDFISFEGDDFFILNNILII